MYGLDEYGQLGLTSVVTVARDLRFEAGVIAQQSHGEYNLSFKVNFAWGAAWGIGVLKADRE